MDIPERPALFFWVGRGGDGGRVDLEERGGVERDWEKWREKKL